MVFHVPCTLGMFAITSTSKFHTFKGTKIVPLFSSLRFRTQSSFNFSRSDAGLAAATSVPFLTGLAWIAALFGAMTCKEASGALGTANGSTWGEKGADAPARCVSFCCMPRFRVNVGESAERGDNEPKGGVTCDNVEAAGWCFCCWVVGGTGRLRLFSFGMSYLRDGANSRRVGKALSDCRSLIRLCDTIGAKLEERLECHERIAVRLGRLVHHGKTAANDERSVSFSCVSLWRQNWHFSKVSNIKKYTDMHTYEFNVLHGRRRAMTQNMGLLRAPHGIRSNQNHQYMCVCQVGWRGRVIFSKRVASFALVGGKWPLTRRRVQMTENHTWREVHTTKQAFSSNIHQQRDVKTRMIHRNVPKCVNKGSCNSLASATELFLGWRTCGRRQGLSFESAKEAADISTWGRYTTDEVGFVAVNRHTSLLRWQEAKTMMLPKILRVDSVGITLQLDGYFQ